MCIWQPLLGTGEALGLIYCVVVERLCSQDTTILWLYRNILVGVKLHDKLCNCGWLQWKKSGAHADYMSIIRMIPILFDCKTELSPCWLFDCETEWSPCWLFDCETKWSPCWLFDCETEWSPCWLILKQNGPHADWLWNRVVPKLTDCETEWSPYWLFNCETEWSLPESLYLT